MPMADQQRAAAELVGEGGLVVVVSVTDDDHTPEGFCLVTCKNCEDAAALLAKALACIHRTCVQASHTYGVPIDVLGPIVAKVADMMMDGAEETVLSRWITQKSSKRG